MTEPGFIVGIISLVMSTGALRPGIAAVVMMPLYFVLTCLMLAWQKEPPRAYRLAAAAFVPWLAPFIVWLARHPAAYGATIQKYGVYDANQLNAVQGLRSFLSFTSVSQRLSQYWNFFNPSFLFFGSGTKVMFSTGLAGVFLLTFAVFLVIGIYRALKQPTPLSLILVAGFATAPLPALVVAEENAIFRALSLLPFGVLLATMGVEYLWSASIHKPLRAIQPAGRRGTGRRRRLRGVDAVDPVTDYAFVGAARRARRRGPARRESRPRQAVEDRRGVSARIDAAAVLVVLVGLLF